MATYLLRGGRIIDPASGLDATGDLLIDGAAIRERSTSRISPPSGATVIDCEGCIVAPGLIDPHVHLREPGQEHKETILSGASAAIEGGFTTVCCMPNTTPALDLPSLVDFVRLKAQEAGKARVFTVGAATVGRKGEELAPMGAMAKAGAVAFSDDGDCIESAAMMHKVLLTCAALGKAFMQHCQDASLTKGGVMNAGAVAARLGLGGWPAVAEEVIIERDVRLNARVGAMYHAQHLSSGGSVEIIKRARDAGQRVTGEVSPHHLLLTDELCEGYNTQAKMNPPLRTDSDVQALRQAVADGIITVLGTDHAPHAVAEKARDFTAAPFGIIGLECALPLYAKALVESGAIDWPRLVALLTIEPARLCGLDGCGLGTLTVHGPADVTVIDPTMPWTIDAESFVSLSRNCPFDGWPVTGRATHVFVRGELLLARTPARQQ
jgi:dihydroorotase